MTKQNQEFILIPKNLKEKDFELSGREAMDLAFLVKENIPIPASFIISTIAFDEFLVENNLVGHIAKELKSVRPFIKQSASDASAKIKKLILLSKLPDELRAQLEFTYSQMSRDNLSPIVTMITSNIIDEKYIPAEQSVQQEILLQGVDDLEYQVKLTWCKLFSSEALEFRANSYYKGDISVGIIVQKLVRSEVSGITNSATSNSDEEIEVKAIYGVTSDNFYDVADTYLLDKSTLKVINKHVLPQSSMLIHNLKDNQKDPYTSVELSSTWSKKQKLEDEMVILIARTARKIESLFSQHVVVKWGVESGEVYVLGLDPLVIEKTTKQAPIEKMIEIDKSKKNNEVDLDKLAEEVMEIVEKEEQANKEPVVTKIKEEEIAPEPKIEFPEFQKDVLPEDESLKYIDDFLLKQALLIDISKMNSKHLSALQYFTGSFYDGTEMLLNNNILPEEHTTNQTTLINLLEKFTLDLSTASRCAIHKPLIYQLSSISQLELKLLGVDENKYKYNLDERFIDYPESLSLEVMAIKKARITKNCRNINICIPSLRNLSNLEDIEKVLSLTGLKRASNFRIYAEVSIPSFIFELDRIKKNKIDGIVVNYSKLLKSLTFRNELREVDHEIGFRMLELLQTLAKEKNLEFIVRLTNYSVELIKYLDKLNPQQIIFTNIPSQEVIKTLSDS